MLYILKKFELYPAVMVANYYLDRLANAGKSIFPPCFLTFYCSDRSLLPFLKS